jgi:uncharacterized protein YPO0396
MSERTIYPGQVRLARLQVVNWGTFCGYKDLPISRQGVLFTGPSGSGKSSLMDAHSAVLLPTVDQRFNASADLTARGAKQSTRSAAAYVRGAWSETSDEFDQAQVRYLRAGKPTWSAIGATYDDGLGQLLTAIVVKWFPGTDTDGASLRTMYHLHDGELVLTVLNEWAERDFDTAWFKRAYPPVCRTPDQTNYLRELRARVRLGESHHALALLGKAKAMKNVGDLNLFIRDNMLDEPETFAAAERMLGLFQPLNEAHRTAERAYRQSSVLDGLPDLWRRYQDSSRTRRLAESLLGEPVETYLRHLYVTVLEREIERIDAQVETLDALLLRQETVVAAARATYELIDRQFQQEGAALTLMETELKAARLELDSRLRSYQFYSGWVGRLALDCPIDEAGFTRLRRELPAIQAADTAALPGAEQTRTTAMGEHAETVKAHQAAADDLIALQSATHLIPALEARRRDLIAQGAGVSAADLPYAAELIDVADGQERWRPAAEKVLRGFGLRLLVPDKHKDTVRRFIDEHDMRGVVEYSIVTAASAHRPNPQPHTLASKLTVDPHHPYRDWLFGQLVNQFEHVCVETARELDAHRIGVTIRGTVKLPGNRYRKDDRPELSSPSTYILGANTAAKLAALQADIKELAGAVAATRAAAEGADQAYRSLQARIEGVELISSCDTWDSIDVETAKKRRHDLEEQIAAIKSDNLDLRTLEQQRQEAHDDWEHEVERAGTAKRDLTQAGNRSTGYVDTLEQEKRKPHHIGEADDLALLESVLAAVEAPADPEDMPRARSAFRRELDQRRKDADGEHRNTESKIKTAVDTFIEQWPDAAPDTTGEVARCGQDFAALYEDIVKRRLPDAMVKFQRIISEDMVPSISMLLRAIETSGQQIRQRVAMVNEALRRAEFNPGVYLQIAHKPTPSDDGKAFRSQVDELMSNAPAARGNAKASLAQFQRVQRLMAMFTADTTEARRWRTNVLDVRNTFAFYAREVDQDNNTHATHSNTAVNSGGEQEKFVAFCLAAALSYNLADADSHGIPRFAPLMLDEAFSKSDEEFSAQALSVFDEFGFQLLIAAPIRMSGIVEPFIGQAILVEKRTTADGARSDAASATFGELAARRIEAGEALRAVA